MSDEARLSLNRSEHMCLASEGYLGPINISMLVRFEGAIELATLRAALRELTSAYPRMRAVLVPTLTTHELAILPDDVFVDQLLDDALRVRRGVDPTSSAALEALHDEVVNDPIAVERGLPWRAIWLPHPTRPALLFSISHLVGDGRSVLQMLTALGARLRGESIAPCPIDAPSQLPGLAPLAWWLWPASAVAYVRNSRRDARLAAGTAALDLASRSSPRFTASGVRHHELSVSASALRAMARRMNTTMNTLVVAALANALLARAKDAPRAAATIRVSVDLRRYFPKGTAPTCGNFVGSFVVRATHGPSLAAQVRAIDAQARDHLARYERRQLALPYLFLSLVPVIGRRLYSLLLLEGKARGLAELPTCHVTNVGEAAGALASHGAGPRVTDLHLATVSPVPMISVVTLGGRVFLTAMYQRDEVEPETLAAVLAGVDAQLRADVPVARLEAFGPN